MVVAFSKNRKDSGQITEEGSDETWRRRGLGYEGEVLYGESRHLAEKFLLVKKMGSHTGFLG